MHLDFWLFIWEAAWWFLISAALTVALCVAARQIHRGRETTDDGRWTTDDEQPPTPAPARPGRINSTEDLTLQQALAYVEHLGKHRDGQGGNVGPAASIDDILVYDRSKKTPEIAERLHELSEFLAAGGRFEGDRRFYRGQRGGK